MLEEDFSVALEQLHDAHSQAVGAPKVGCWGRGGGCSSKDSLSVAQDASLKLCQTCAVPEHVASCCLVPRTPQAMKNTPGVFFGPRWLWICSGKPFAALIGDGFISRGARLHRSASQEAAASLGSLQLPGI